MVAGAAGDDPGLIALEASASLMALAADPGALVTACRRLVDHQPTCGPVWWLAARVLAAPDPGSEARRAAGELADDPTEAVLAAELPPDAVVCVVGWPDQAAGALRHRPDLTVLVVDAGREGAALAAHLNGEGGQATVVPESGLGAAAARSDIVVLQASALGHGGVCARSGSRAAAAVGRDSGRPVWAVAGVGRVLPEALWDALVDRIPGGQAWPGQAPGGQAPGGQAWDRPDEVVPLRLVDQVVGPEGVVPAEESRSRADCPPVPELTRKRGPSFRQAGPRGLDT